MKTKWKPYIFFIVLLMTVLLMKCPMKYRKNKHIEKHKRRKKKHMTRKFAILILDIMIHFTLKANATDCQSV